jgi:protein-S-isoprenylcysteine O-methyltransferase Ste14
VQTNSWFASAIILFSFLISYSFIKYILFDFISDEILPRLWLIGSLIPLFIIAYIQNPNKNKGKNLNSIDWQRIRGKTVVLSIQLFLIYVFSIIVTEFGLANYNTFNNDVFIMTPILILFIICYVYFVDRRLLSPYDDYAYIADILNKRIEINKYKLKVFLLKTLVKIIFVPFMYSGIIGNLNILLSTNWDKDIASISLLLFNIGINLDMLIGVFGYIFSSAIIDNKIKDTDSNIIGWIFALLCYPPLVFIVRVVNNQSDNIIWSDIIPTNSHFFWIFAVVINLTWIIYWLATFEFGMTFSNLSWRRIINTGVYKYTKHPAYIAKNLYWWLYTLPFLGVSFLSFDWWKNVLGLVFVSLIYYGRAKSEERHLLKFKDYSHLTIKVL